MGSEMCIRDSGDITEASLWQTPLWGFGRTLQLEHPELGVRCVDLASESCGLDELLSELARNDGERQVSYRSGARHVARLAHVDAVASSASEFQLDPDASYLITGGLGALGLKVAEFFVARGAKYLVLSCLLYTSPSPRDATLSRMPSSA